MKRIFLIFVGTLGFSFASVAAPQLKPLEVLKAFRTAGLDAGTPVSMEPKDFGFAPLVGEEAFRFKIPSVCSDCNGRIFAVSDPAELKSLKSYYEKLGKGSAALFSWVYTRKNIVLQLNGEMKRAKALKYKAVLEALN